MARSGGESDKLGNLYEAIWTVECCIDVALGRFRAITVEAIGDIARGVEFHLEAFDGTLEFHSVKRQTQGADWSIAKLCKAETKETGTRSILGDLSEKLVDHPSAQLRFISASGANNLRELTERSRSVESLEDYYESLSAQLKSEFQKRVVLCCNGDAAFALSAMQVTEVIPRGHEELKRSVERRLAGLFYSKDGTPLDTADLRRALGEFVLEKLAIRLDSTTLLAFFDERGVGLRDWKQDTSIVQKIATVNANYLRSVESELVNGSQIVRSECQAVLDIIGDEQSKGVIISAPAGYGKSCVSAQVARQLSEIGIPTLCLRFDFIRPCSTTRQLGEQLDLPASPSVVLGGVADNSPSVLVIDQLDAMSLLSGRSTALWNVFSELKEEVEAYPNMRLVIACRDFDLSHDARLRSLVDSTLRSVAVGLLSRKDLMASLTNAGLSEFRPTEKQTEILSVPFHLLLFLQGTRDHDFNSVAELYDCYWERKQQNLLHRLGREPKWNDVIDALTQRMTEDRALVAPAIEVESWASDAQAMASEHVLIKEERTHAFRFFHESFFDYAYARRFCATNQSIVEFLKGTDQHLFHRSQVRQVLAFRRTHDFVRYLTDLSQLLQSNDVRFHIKRLAASFISSLDDPTNEECSALRDCLIGKDISSHLLPVMRQSVPWFDCLDENGLFTEWLAGTEQEANLAIWWLENRDLQEVRSARIARLVAPYSAAADDAWVQRIINVVSAGQAHASKEMRQIFFEFLDRGIFDEKVKTRWRTEDIWGLIRRHDKCPEFVIDVVAAWFERSYRTIENANPRRVKDSFSHNNSDSGVLLVTDAAKASPLYFARKMLPLVTSAADQLSVHREDGNSNHIWEYISNSVSAYEVLDAILLGLKQALEHTAQAEPIEARTLLSSHLDQNDAAIAFLVLSTYAANPEPFANECVDYLVSNKSNLNVGYDVVMGTGNGAGRSAVSRIAIEACSQHCAAPHLRFLEDNIIGHCRKYEVSTPRKRGYTELLLLSSIPQNRISEKAANRLEELRRKFPDVNEQIAETDTASYNRVGSPIPDEAFVCMSDAQWLSAMRKYDKLSAGLDGGLYELAPRLVDLAREDRTRFFGLLAKMPDGIHPQYFSYILDGLSGSGVEHQKKEADDQEIANTSVVAFAKAIRHMHDLLSRPCGKSILSALRRLAHLEFPNDVIEIAAYYALNDPDPTHEASVSNDIMTDGINTVRGTAGQTISALISRDHRRIDILRPALQALARDPVTSVRALALSAFTAVLNVDRDEAVRYATTACSGNNAILATQTFEQFVHYAIYSHYSDLEELLQIALNSGEAKASEIAARQILIAELAGEEVGSLGDSIRTGNERMRSVAAGVFAVNLCGPEHREKCSGYLIDLFKDDSQEVLERAASAFRDLQGDILLEMEPLLTEFVETDCLLAEPLPLLRSLSKSNVKLPRVITRATQRLIEAYGADGGNIAQSGALYASEISTLVVRQYQQAADTETQLACLSLIDELEKYGYYGISEELKNHDR